jgi:NADH-quinone oxidoreductase subunit N
LSFVPKAAGLTALIRVLLAVAGGPVGMLPDWLLVLLWVIAVASMSIGNVLGLMQHNIKRLMACSSIAHSGYMLAGVLVAFGASIPVRNEALRGVLFYLSAYGLMNAGVFAVLMMLPARSDPFEHDGQVPPATTAETFAEIAGMGRREVGLGLIMSACCFSLIGLPLTIGFFGKFYLIRPALQGGYYWLVILMVLNAAVSAGYYLRIVATMFLKDPKSEAEGACVPGACMKTIALVLAGILSAGGAVLFGTVIPTTSMLRTMVTSSTELRPSVRGQSPTVQLPQVQQH